MNALERLAPEMGLTVVDVGARGGADGRLLPIAPMVDIVGFEPDAAECAALNRQIQENGAAPWRWIRYLPMAVGRNEKERPFYVTRSPDLSSLLRPNTALHRTFPSAERLEVVDELKVRTLALDRLAADSGSGVAGAVFLKVDTQGSELEVLRGGEKLIQTSVMGMEVEVEFQEQYVNQPLAADVDAYVRSLGFELYWCGHFYMPGEIPGCGRQISHMNALYLRSPTRTGERSLDLWRAWLAIAACYGLGEACLRTVNLLEQMGVEPRATLDNLRTGCSELARPQRWSLRRRASLLRTALGACFDPSVNRRRTLAYKALKEQNAAGVTWRMPTPGL